MTFVHILFISRTDMTCENCVYYSDVIMSASASQITGVSTVCTAVCSSADKKTSKPRVTGLCVRNSQVTGEFPAQKASNEENICIWWRHHVKRLVNFPHLIIIRLKLTTMDVIFVFNRQNCRKLLQGIVLLSYKSPLAIPHSCRFSYEICIGVNLQIK